MLVFHGHEMLSSSLSRPSIATCGQSISSYACKVCLASEDALSLHEHYLVISNTIHLMTPSVVSGEPEDPSPPSNTSRPSESPSEQIRPSRIWQGVMLIQSATKFASGTGRAHIHFPRSTTLSPRRWLYSSPATKHSERRAPEQRKAKENINQRQGTTAGVAIPGRALPCFQLSCFVPGWYRTTGLLILN